MEHSYSHSALVQEQFEKSSLSGRFVGIGLNRFGMDFVHATEAVHGMMQLIFEVVSRVFSWFLFFAQMRCML